MPVILEMFQASMASLIGREQLICFSTTATNCHYFTTAAFTLDTVTLVQHIYYHWMLTVVSLCYRKGHISYSTQACHTAFT